MLLRCFPGWRKLCGSLHILKHCSFPPIISHRDQPALFFVTADLSLPLPPSLQVLKHKAEEAEQKLAALDAKVAETAAAAAAAKAESAAASSAAAAAASATTTATAAAPAPLGVNLTSMGSAGAVAEGMAASGGASASGDVAQLTRKVAELEQQLMTTSSTAIDANSVSLCLVKRPACERRG